MIIKKTGFGNDKEAFIEKRFNDGVNIIFSNDNNRGKTLLMQSLIYSIGYEGIFPTGFNSNDYYFYSNIVIQNKEYEFLRKGNSILIINGKILNQFETISEFKYFFDKNIFKLPKIQKNGELKTVDLNLFYEIFFLGQDRRNTSNIIIKNQNNKEDFMNMIYSFKGIGSNISDKYSIEDLKEEKLIIEGKLKLETKKLSLIKKNPNIASYVTSTGNDKDFKSISDRLKKINNNITELRKKRNREESRKIKLESLITELTSLNRSLSEGKVKCSNCGSNKITFSNKEFNFDVSNNFVRKNIVASIYEQISLKDEIIREYDRDIMIEQENINKFLEKDLTPDIKNYILFDDEIKDSKDIDKVIYGLKLELEKNKLKIENDKLNIIDNKSEQSELSKDIIDKMGKYYLKIDSEGTLIFSSLFTKNNETYSGSEEQEYYFCKIMSLNDILSHNFPIVIDSFREGELSTLKEELMLKEFLNLNKQVILTSTLKDEEYTSDKYYKIEGINVIDFSDIKDSKILDEKYVNDFLNLIKSFNVFIE